jgi:hypothetical protein
LLLIQEVTMAQWVGAVAAVLGILLALTIISLAGTNCVVTRLGSSTYVYCY